MIFIDDKYELVSQISYTNTSKIYKAYDHNTSKFVAIKIIKILDSDDQKLVKNEVKVMSILKCVVIPHYIGWCNYGSDAFCIIMEYLDSITLKEKMIAKNGLWSFSEIIMIFSKILDGVFNIHFCGVVHNDLKPENIIYLRDGGIKIIDFGISTILNKKAIFAKLKGTPKYIAPEIIKHKESDERSDIYSLGIILYELLTGVSPFENYNKDKIIKLQIENKFVHPKLLNPEISKELDAVVIKALQTRPIDRYQNIKEFKHEFEKATNKLK